MKTENKRHLCLCAAAVVSGILFSARPTKIWAVLCALLLCACICFLKTCKNKREAAAVGILLAAAAATAFFRCEYQTQQYQQIIRQFPSESSVRVSGTVCRKEIRETGILYYLKNSSYEYQKKIYDGGRILLYAEDDSVPAGAVLQGSGEGELFEHAANEGGFDAADYYRTQNIAFRVFADEIRMAAPPKLPVAEWLFQLKKKMLAVYESELGERDAGVLSAMALGSRDQLDEDTKRLYQTSGISHILAISGLHISLIGLGLFRFLRKIRCSWMFSAAAGSAVVICFAVMSGFGVSSRRAVIMYLCLAGAQALGRTYDPVNALAAAAAVILLQNPLALFQSGFLFSFTAAVSVLLTSSAVSSRKREAENEKRSDAGWKKKILADFQNRILVNLGIQLWLLPLTARFYFEVPLFSLFLNLLVLPLCGWLLGFAIAGGVLGAASALPVRWLFVPCHLILDLYESAMKVFGFLPGDPLLTGQPPLWVLFFYFLLLSLLAVGYFCFPFPRDRGCAAGVLSGKLVSEHKNRGIHVRKEQGDGLRGSGFLAKAAVRLAAVAVLLVLCLQFPHPNRFRADFLDVGQGDGVCVSTGNGYHIFVDGGSTDEGEVGTYRILPFLKYNRIGQIDAWIITHGDEDHISGVIEMLETGYPVSQLLLAGAMPRDEAWEDLTAAAKLAGTAVRYVRAGSALKIGGGIRMRCLYPEATERETDRNALSQVWELKKGEFSFLFTGDIGEEQERLMLERGLLHRADVLKAAHHGSKNSSSAAFLEQVSPKLTVISCGRDNRYGHPHQEALARIEAAGSGIVRTDETGQITVWEDRKGLRVRFPCKRKSQR